MADYTEEEYRKHKVSPYEAIKGEIKRRVNDVISSPVKGVQEYGTGGTVQDRKRRNKEALDDA